MRDLGRQQWRIKPKMDKVGQFCFKSAPASAIFVSAAVKCSHKIIALLFDLALLDLAEIYPAGGRSISESQNERPSREIWLLFFPRRRPESIVSQNSSSSARLHWAQGADFERPAATKALDGLQPTTDNRA